jgi:polyphenol oxidase
MNQDWLRPFDTDRDRPSAIDVGAVMTTRRGGVSLAPYDTMNLGLRVGDDGTAVSTNRRVFASSLGAEPVFLHQVHGAHVVRLGRQHLGQRDDDAIEADAAFTTEPRIACTIQIADCMPVLVASRDGRVTGAAHAGWRGLAAGVLENTVHAMCEAVGCAPQDLLAWMGPCIGPAHFEVGADVLDAFVDHAACFKDAPRADGAMRWLADLPAIARAKLGALGVDAITGGTGCTVAEPLRFYSYRRDKITGRHAAAIWIR